MLLQTNSYVVPRERRMEHARILRRFRQTLLRLGCDHFEVYEQVGANWSAAETSGRFVQIMRFRDRKHQLAVQAAEREDPSAQALLREFCELINLPYQQQQGLFAVGFYTSFLRMPTAQLQADHESANQGMAAETEHPVQSDENAEGETEETGSNGSSPEDSTSESSQSEASAEEVASVEQSAQVAPESPTTEETTPGATEPGDGEASAPELEAAEQGIADEQSPADAERISHESIAPADANEDELNAEARNELPIEADGLDSESVFLGAVDGDLDDPGSIRPLPMDDDAEADTEKPSFPSKS